MKTYKLSELGTIITGNTPPTKNKEYYDSNDIKFIKPNNIPTGKKIYLDQSNNYISEKARKKARLVPINSVLVTCIGIIGKVSVTKEEVAFNQQINAIVPNEKVLPEYLALKIKYKKNSLEQLSNKSIVSSINKTNFSKFEIRIPSIKEQERFLEVIKKSITIIEKRQQQIESLSALKQSIFLDMFGDPNINPNGYVKKSLKKVSEVITGNTPPRKDTDNYGNHIEWIKSNNISDNKIYLTQAQEYLSEKGASIGRVVPENSILVTCIAGSRSSIGRAAIANREVAFNQQINAIIPSDYVDTSFLFAQIKILQPYIQSFSTNSMKGMISKTNFEKIEVIVPKQKEQLKFSYKFNEIILFEEQLKKSLNNIEKMYDSLLYKALNGELFKEDIKV